MSCMHAWTRRKMILSTEMSKSPEELCFTSEWRLIIDDPRKCLLNRNEGLEIWTNKRNVRVLYSLKLYDYMKLLRAAFLKVWCQGFLNYLQSPSRFSNSKWILKGCNSVYNHLCFPLSVKKTSLTQCNPRVSPGRY